MLLTPMAMSGGEERGGTHRPPQAETGREASACGCCSTSMAMGEGEWAGGDLLRHRP